MKGTVGASIVGIVTESLYDKPIVVFREYVQNAADSLCEASSEVGYESLSSTIWFKDGDLFFLDNGTGIAFNSFEQTMISIANSGKRKTENIGYKGIGRLSGISYCRKLTFVNIVDYANDIFQEYCIDCEKYAEICRGDDFADLDFAGLMSKIGTFATTPDISIIKHSINNYRELFDVRNTGFLVILKEISNVLQNVLNDEQFMDNLGWLLPVPFKQELTTPTTGDNDHYKLFLSLDEGSNSTSSQSSVPAKSFCITYCGEQIYRPLTNAMLRTYLCQSNIDQYAICVHTFSNKKIEIEKGNPFSGIRIYIDNMLLCDENELIPALQQYGLIRHGTYEMIQSVRGIGAMIYVVDKVNISANARRTFIDVTDADSIEFLTLIGEFVENIYRARYALSYFESAKKKIDINQEKLAGFRSAARSSLETLSTSDITVELEEVDAFDYQSLSSAEKKRYIKGLIMKELNACMKKYLAQSDEYNPNTCYEDFKAWINAN